MPIEKKPRKPQAPSPKRRLPRAPTGASSKAKHSASDAAKAAAPKAVTGKALPGKAAPGKAVPGKAKSPSLRGVVLGALEDMKALEVKILDVRGLTDIADYMVIASGTSDRHVRSVAQRVVEKTKEAGFRPHGIEGQQDADWVLIDLHEYIVHVMLPRVREFYGLEKLWDLTAKRAVRA